MHSLAKLVERYEDIAHGNSWDRVLKVAANILNKLLDKTIVYQLTGCYMANKRYNP